MDTAQKIEEGLKQLSDDNFYKPLASPIVLETAKKVSDILNKLFRSGNIDTMTHKWLKIGLEKPRIPEFYTLTKIHKKIPVDRPIVSGRSGLQSVFQVLLTHFYNQSSLNKSHI